MDAKELAAKLNGRGIVFNIGDISPF